MSSNNGTITETAVMWKWSRYLKQRLQDTSRNYLYVIKQIVKPNGNCKKSSKVLYKLTHIHIK